LDHALRSGSTPMRCIADGCHKLELQLEGDLNITAVWGTGDVSEKPVGFTDVRVKSTWNARAIPQSEIDALVTHVRSGHRSQTFTRPVNLEVMRVEIAACVVAIVASQPGSGI